ncbi:MAG TPA: hypothetical protein VFJ16_06445 [Longimicrobium sp.]|nr:hypothetical protein [Longimicrobium sp.]
MTMERGKGATGHAHALLEDGSLIVVSAGARAHDLVELWLPLVTRNAAMVTDGTDARAVIRVRAGEPPHAPPPGAPAMEMSGVGGWVTGDGETVVFADAAGAIGVTVDLAARRAEVCVRTDRDPPETVQVVSTLTMVSALLLTRLRRALVHAGAVLPPGGGAWLLAGGSFSGKTSTCVTLIRGGWGWLSDDHVVLGRMDGEIRVEGWPRRFNLDHGYASGASRGVRSRVDPEAFGPGAWQSTAPLAGLLFPRVEAGAPTALVPLHPAGALALLVRNAPWLLADARGAAPVLSLFQRAARLPAYELRLGADSYCNADRLQMVLGPVIHSQIRTSARVET